MKPVIICFVVWAIIVTFIALVLVDTKIALLINTVWFTGFYVFIILPVVFDVIDQNRD